MASSLRTNGEERFTVRPFQELSLSCRTLRGRGRMSRALRAIFALGFDVSHWENIPLWQKKQEPGKGGTRPRCGAKVGLLTCRLPDWGLGRSVPLIGPSADLIFSVGISLLSHPLELLVVPLDLHKIIVCEF